jgi:hypothetical protein
MSVSARANRHGRSAEDSIADFLRRQGCEFLRQVDVGRSIFNKRIRADFLVTNIEEFPTGLVVESKWQDTTGTADEKYAYLLENVRSMLGYRHPVLVVLGGGGACPGATQYLEHAVDGQRLVGVFSFDRFMSWIQRDVHIRRTTLW